jgi:hypothetical protein
MNTGLERSTNLMMVTGLQFVFPAPPACPTRAVEFASDWVYERISISSLCPAALL